jgi:hypothetical protein
MPFTTTLSKAHNASNYLTVNGEDLDDDDWSYEGNLLMVKATPMVSLFFDLSQQIEVSDTGLANVFDINGEDHEIIFERLRPLCASDIE